VKFKRQSVSGFGLESTAIADIVFLLLIFFMLTSNFVIDNAVNIELPESSAAKVEPLEDVTVTIDHDGHVYVDGKLTDEFDLRKVIEGKLLRLDTETVIFRGDRKATLEKLVLVMDIAKRAGAKKLAVATTIKE
jgi:biopolymer transport protein ExbD